MLAVERCLINKLPSLFPSGTILDLRDDEVAYIARESDTLALERSRYGQKLATLEDAKTDLKQLDIHRALDLGKRSISGFAALQIPTVYSIAST